MIHQLKLVQPHFDAVASGQKTFEIRKDDRGFQLGDVLVLREYDPATETYSGKELHRTVTHILRGEEWGLQEGYVVLSIREIEQQALDLSSPPDEVSQIKYNGHVINVEFLCGGPDETGALLRIDGQGEVVFIEADEIHELRCELTDFKWMTLADWLQEDQQKKVREWLEKQQIVA